MNKEFQLKYLPSFYRDLDKIINYIKYELKNTIAAKKLLEEIEQEIEKRKYNPNIYEKYKSSKKRKNVYYKIHVKNYIIFYVVEGNVIEIRRILYSRRDFKKLI